MANIRQRKNSTRKETIIETAARLFRERGFSATSMRDLAEQVGVEAASLYNHISSKAEILQELCFKVANKFMSDIDKVDAEDISSMKKIEAVLRFHIKQIHLTDPYLSNIQTQRRVYRQRIASIIEEGIRKNEIKKIDAPTAVLIMLHAVSGIESWHRSKQKISGDVLEENMIAILIGGLQNK